MTASIFRDNQSDENPLNGTAVTPRDVSGLLRSFAGREPFFFELMRDGGPKLDVGIASTFGCVQFTDADMGDFWMAVWEPDVDEEFVEFLAGGTPTAVSVRYRLPLNLVETLVSAFLSEEDPRSIGRWESI